MFFLTAARLMLFCPIRSNIHHCRHPPPPPCLSVQHFRSRARFAVREADGQLQYCMWDKGSMSIVVTEFTMATLPIHRLMTPLLRAIEASPSVRDGLEAINFLSSSGAGQQQQGQTENDDDAAGCGSEVIATLVYSKPVTREKWLEPAKAVAQLCGNGVMLMARSKGVVLMTDRDHLGVEYAMQNGTTIVYKQTEGAFSNPNPHMAVSTLE